MMHIVDNHKLQVNFEVVILQVGLDVFQNTKVIIIKKEDTTIPCKILVYEFGNGCNIVVNFCIPLGNT